MKRILKVLLALAFALTLSFALVGCGGPSDGQITLEMYNQIQNGMTHDEVAEIVGSRGTESARTGEGEFTTFIITYEGYGSLGANAIFTFQGSPAVVISRAQVGLR